MDAEGLRGTFGGPTAAMGRPGPAILGVRKKDETVRVSISGGPERLAGRLWDSRRSPHPGTRLLPVPFLSFPQRGRHQIPAQLRRAGPRRVDETLGGRYQACFPPANQTQSSSGMCARAVAISGSGRHADSAILGERHLLRVCPQADRAGDDRNRNRNETNMWPARCRPLKTDHAPPITGRVLEDRHCPIGSSGRGSSGHVEFS
jgi:hypothetical protein